MDDVPTFSDSASISKGGVRRSVKWLFITESFGNPKSSKGELISVKPCTKESNSLENSPEHSAESGTVLAGCDDGLISVAGKVSVCTDVLPACISVRLELSALPSSQAPTLLGASRGFSRVQPGRFVTKYTQAMPLFAHREHTGLPLRHLTLNTCTEWQLSLILAIAEQSSRGYPVLVPRS
jgi:hypothetical protein